MLMYGEGQQTYLERKALVSTRLITFPTKPRHVWQAFCRQATWKHGYHVTASNYVLLEGRYDCCRANMFVLY